MTLVGKEPVASKEFVPADARLSRFQPVVDGGGDVTTHDWSAVVLAAVPYDGTRPLGDWQLSRVLGRRRPLLYVEPPHSIARGLRRGAVLRPAGDGSLVHVLTPTATPAYDRPLAGDFADLVIGRQVSAAAQNCLQGPLVMFACTPRRGLLRVPHDLLLYWQRDTVELLARRGNANRLGRRHRRLMRNAHVITGVSPELVESSRADGRDAIWVPNGCDYEHFSTTHPRPAGLPSGRVVIGFGGGVSDRVDVPLLMSLAEARPEWLFVVVGEIAHPLPSKENVYATGRRPYWEMPGWMQAFDVGLIPYIEDDRNLHSNPLKALEYLAAGTPVVSVPIAGLHAFKPAVRLASGTEDFLQTLDQLVANPVSAAECREIATNESWTSRVDVLEQIVEAHLTLKRTAADGRAK